MQFGNTTLHVVLFMWISMLIFPQTTIVNPVCEYNAANSVDQDDMCIWLHPTDKSLSTIIGSDKSSDKIYVYDLQGNLLQTIDASGQEPY